MFDRLGEFRFPLSGGSADEVLEKAIDAGADDVVSGDEGGPRDLLRAGQFQRRARGAREIAGPAQSVAKLTWRPKTGAPVEGEAADPARSSRSALEDNDDVQNVYANFEVSDDALAKFAA
jgi:transcriptional/translational regulatory protein YebC/TACO1